MACNDYVTLFAVQYNGFVAFAHTSFNGTLRCQVDGRKPDLHIRSRCSMINTRRYERNVRLMLTAKGNSNDAEVSLLA